MCLFSCEMFNTLFIIHSYIRSGEKIQQTNDPCVSRDGVSVCLTGLIVERSV